MRKKLAVVLAAVLTFNTLAIPAFAAEDYETFEIEAVADGEDEGTVGAEVEAPAGDEDVEDYDAADDGSEYEDFDVDVAGEGDFEDEIVDVEVEEGEEDLAGGEQQGEDDIVKVETSEGTWFYDSFDDALEVSLKGSEYVAGLDEGATVTLLDDVTLDKEIVIPATVVPLTIVLDGNNLVESEDDGLYLSEQIVDATLPNADGELKSKATCRGETYDGTELKAITFVEHTFNTTYSWVSDEKGGYTVGTVVEECTEGNCDPESIPGSYRGVVKSKENDPEEGDVTYSYYLYQAVLGGSYDWDSEKKEFVEVEVGEGSYSLATTATSTKTVEGIQTGYEIKTAPYIVTVNGHVQHDDGVPVVKTVMIDKWSEQEVDATITITAATKDELKALGSKSVYGPGKVDKPEYDPTITAPTCTAYGNDIFKVVTADPDGKVLDTRYINDTEAVAPVDHEQGVLIGIDVSKQTVKSVGYDSEDAARAAAKANGDADVLSEVVASTVGEETKYNYWVWDSVVELMTITKSGSVDDSTTTLGADYAHADGTILYRCVYACDFDDDYGVKSGEPSGHKTFTGEAQTINPLSNATKASETGSHSSCGKWKYGTVKISYTFTKNHNPRDEVKTTYTYSLTKLAEVAKDADHVSHVSDNTVYTMDRHATELQNLKEEDIAEDLKPMTVDEFKEALKQPTSKDKGKAAVKCAICGKYALVDVPKTSCVFGAYEGADPTTAAITGVKNDSRKHTLSTDKTTATVPATCTLDGGVYAYCTKDSHWVLQEKAEKTGHDLGTIAYDAEWGTDNKGDFVTTFTGKAFEKIFTRRPGTTRVDGADRIVYDAVNENDVWVDGVDYYLITEPVTPGTGTPAFHYDSATDCYWFRPKGNAETIPQKQTLAQLTDGEDPYATTEWIADPWIFNKESDYWVTVQQQCKNDATERVEVTYHYKEGTDTDTDKYSAIDVDDQARGADCQTVAKTIYTAKGITDTLGREIYKVYEKDQKTVGPHSYKVTGWDWNAQFESAIATGECTVKGCDHTGKKADALAATIAQETSEDGVTTYTATYGDATDVKTGYSLKGATVEYDTSAITDGNLVVGKTGSAQQVPDVTVTMNETVIDPDVYDVTWSLTGGTKKTVLATVTFKSDVLEENKDNVDKIFTAKDDDTVNKVYYSYATSEPFNIGALELFLTEAGKFDGETLLIYADEDEDTIPEYNQDVLKAFDYDPAESYSVVTTPNAKDADVKYAMRDEAVDLTKAEKNALAKKYPKTADYNKAYEAEIQKRIEALDYDLDEVTGIHEVGEYYVYATITAEGYTTYTRRVAGIIIQQTKVAVFIDNTTIIEGDKPNLHVRVVEALPSGSSSEGYDTGKVLDVDPSEFEITTLGGEDLENLKVGTYQLRVTSKNYAVLTPKSGYTATLTVLPKDSSTPQEQAKAETVTAEIKDLNADSTDEEIAKVRKDYEDLSDVAKARVDAEEVQKLNDLEAKSVGKKLAAVDEKTSVEDAKKVLEAYEALTPSQKALVDSDPDAKAGKATAEAIVKAAEKAAAIAAAEKAAADAETAAKAAVADPTDAKIKAAADAIAAADKAIAAAKTAGATDAELKKATDAKSAADTAKASADKEKQQKDADAKKLSDFNTAMGKVPAAASAKESDRAAIEAATKAYNALTEQQKKDASVVAAKAKLDDAQKAIDYPTITFKTNYKSKKVKKNINKTWSNGQSTKRSTVKKSKKKLALKGTSSTGAKITYKTSSKKKATVSSSGVVKFKKKGKVTITATCNNTTVKVLLKIK